MNTAFLDIVSGNNGQTRLGRAWLNQKDGKSSMSIDMSSMPLPSEPLHLVNTENCDLGSCVDEYVLRVPIEREGKKTYWHAVGELRRVKGRQRRAFEVTLSSMPMTGNLAAFEKDN